MYAVTDLFILFMGQLPSIFLCIFEMGYSGPLFIDFSSFQTSYSVAFCWIRTWIVGRDGEHADHLTTKAQFSSFL